MAAQTAVRAQHATLSANTVDTVTLGSNYQHAEIYNRSASGFIYFTTNGDTPVIAADDTFVVGPGSAVSVDTPSPTVTVVKLICASGNDYSVTGF